jgi:hypothetical protein
MASMLTTSSEKKKKKKKERPKPSHPLFPKSGGLILLWNTASQVEIQNYSCRHINAVIKPSHGGSPWKFSGFLDPVPWLCVGD